MSKKTLKFSNIRLNKETFHEYKEAIDLFSVNADQIVVSNKLKHNNESFKHFIGYHYANSEIVKPLCIILPRMSGYIKYIEDGGKNLSFFINEVWDKYDKIWDMIKNEPGINFDSEPVYEYRYLKAKVRKFDGVIKTNFLDNDMPKENMHYTCIACITIDSVLRIDKKIIRKFIQESVNIR